MAGFMLVAYAAFDPARMLVFGAGQGPAEYAVFALAMLPMPLGCWLADKLWTRGLRTAGIGCELFWVGMMWAFVVNVNHPSWLLGLWGLSG